MAMSEKERKQLMGLLIALPALAIVLFWMNWRSPRALRLAELNVTIDSMQGVVDSVDSLIARGTSEDLRVLITQYEGGLRLMRRLVPTASEFNELLETVSNRARLREVELGNFNAQASRQVGQFREERYSFEAFGRYDDIAAFLADVAALPRIMVPYQVTIEPAAPDIIETYGDTTGSFLQVQFQIKTYVKRQETDAEENGVEG